MLETIMASFTLTTRPMLRNNVLNGYFILVYLIVQEIKIIQLTLTYQGWKPAYDKFSFETGKYLPGWLPGHLLKPPVTVA